MNENIEMKSAGMESYTRRMEAERAHFNREYSQHKDNDVLVQHVPPAWELLESKVKRLIELEAGGYFLQDYIAHFMNQRVAPRMISLASGPCGLELDIAARLRGDYEVVCVDVNDKLLGLGLDQARDKGLHLSSRIADCNRLDIEEGQYDVVMAFAALHHFVDLEKIFPRIARALRPGGVFVTMDICSRNGYLMWEETFKTVNEIWPLLPDRLKINHTRFGKPTLTPKYENIDYGDNSFECIRSQDILEQLDRHFEPLHYVSYYSLCRRFFDPMYGPNYDLKQPLDRAIIEWLWEFDQSALVDRRLPPETFFGVFRAGGDVSGQPNKSRDKMRRDIMTIQKAAQNSGNAGGERGWKKMLLKKICRCR